MYTANIARSMARGNLEKFIIDGTATVIENLEKRVVEAVEQGKTSLRINEYFLRYNATNVKHDKVSHYDPYAVCYHFMSLGYKANFKRPGGRTLDFIISW